jgi:hypothetical protein
MPPPKDAKRYALYIERQRSARLGKKFPKISEGRKGIVPWNKGLTKGQDCRLNVHHDGQFKKGIRPWSTGLKAVDDERIKKFANAGHDACRGKPTWCKGKKGIHSEDGLRRIAEASRNRFFSVETRAKMSANSLGRKHSEASKEKIRQAKKGFRFSKESKKKMRISHTGLAVGTRNPHYGKPAYPSYPTEYKGIVFKSSWEANVARKFDDFGLFWAYEPKRFFFSHNKFTYTPDFYVFDWACFVEVKGFWDLPSSMKVQSFLSEYSRELLFVEHDMYSAVLNAKSVDDLKEVLSA